jgi:hypothetical protein
VRFGEGSLGWRGSIMGADVEFGRLFSYEKGIKNGELDI